MNIRSISVRKINPAPYNPRVDLKPGDAAYEQLRRSIDDFGCVQPLVWNRRTGNLVGGHQRFKILIERGDRAVDVVVVDLTPAREKLLNLSLNKIQGDWDDQKLAQLLDELIKMPDIDLGLSGFDLPEAQQLIADALGDGDADREETFDVEAELKRQGPIITKPGDLLVLGHHRLLCGDSTDAKLVRQLMNGQRAQLFATDPPYLVNYDGKNHPGSAKKNKDRSGSYGITWDDADANPKLYENFVAVAVAEAIATNAAWYCWHASRRQAMVEQVWNAAGAFVHQQIIWAKDRPILTRSWFSWQHEPCFFGWRRPHKPPRYSDEHHGTVWSVFAPRLSFVRVTDRGFASSKNRKYSVKFCTSLNTRTLRRTSSLLRADFSASRLGNNAFGMSVYRVNDSAAWSRSFALAPCVLTYCIKGPGKVFSPNATTKASRSSRRSWSTIKVV